MLSVETVAVNVIPYVYYSNNVPEAEYVANVNVLEGVVVVGF